MNFDGSLFEAHLKNEEKSAVTIEKYLRDAEAFAVFCGGETLSKELVHAWKEALIRRGYAVRSVNSMLAGVNAWLKYIGREDCRVGNMKLQRQVYTAPEKELDMADYEKLLKASEGRPQLKLLLQTVASTGIRISELRFFTVESVRRGEVVVSCKNKSRVVLIPDGIRKVLLAYCGRRGIRTGIVFRTRGGKALDRSNVWLAMKKLCALAGVDARKVFPHNLRKLFARCFYKLKRDIVKLADVLGHSRIDTTRIYVMTSGTEHRDLMNRLCRLFV